MYSKKYIKKNGDLVVRYYLRKKSEKKVSKTDFSQIKTMVKDKKIKHDSKLK